LLARIQDPSDHRAWSQFVEIYTGPTKIGCLEAFVVYLVSVPLST
jgi:hypothetical protein